MDIGIKKLTLVVYDVQAYNDLIDKDHFEIPNVLYTGLIVISPCMFFFFCLIKLLHLQTLLPLILGIDPDLVRNQILVLMFNSLADNEGKRGKNKTTGLNISIKGLYTVCSMHFLCLRPKVCPKLLLSVFSKYLNRRKTIWNSRIKT